MPHRIRPYLLSGQAFSDADLHIMGEAFDKAKAILAVRPLQIELNEVATQIIALAVHGERDPQRLCNTALGALGIEA